MDGLIKGIVLSLLPISELRGGIPVAMASGVGWVTAFITCVVANILVIIPVFFFLDNIHKYLMKIKIYEKIFTTYLESVRKRVEAKMEKHTWEYWVLFLFAGRFQKMPTPNITPKHTVGCSSIAHYLPAPNIYTCNL